MRYQSLLYIIIILSLSACSGVKNLSQPDTSMPEVFHPGQSADSTCIAEMKWWEFYTDSTLYTLIDKALKNNRDLLKAYARIEEARNLYGIEKLNYLPDINGLVGANHETNKYDGLATTKDPEYDLKLSVNWEINLFGALSWAQKSSLAKYEATIDDYNAMKISLIAETASAYFSLMALKNELHIVRQTLATRWESLNQARLRFEGGLTSETVYQQAKVEYATTAALVPNLERQVKAASNAITLLIGEYPHDIIGSDKTIQTIGLPEKLPAGLTSTLLERRPDIKAAEHRLAAAMADVGLSYANRFPNFRLNLTGGLENDGLANFFKSPFTYILGNITGTVFDFGKKKRKYKAAIAVYDQAKYSYEQSVIKAFTEVNTAIEAYRRVQENRALKAELRDASSKYVQLAHIQYRAGSLNYIDVLDAQRRYFEAQISVSNAYRDEYLAVINLYKVLGGGWSADTPE